jgi:hypothetical protein
MVVDFECMITAHRDGKTRYTKTCDSCGKESEVTKSDIKRSRNRHAGKDYCLKCACSIKNSGRNNPAKRPEVREKISRATRGKTKGPSPKFQKIKLTTNGYVLEWDEGRRKHIPQHRLVMERFLQRKLKRSEQVHHVDGDKQNNNPSNLYLCKNAAEHTKLHKQLEDLAMKLVANGSITFSHTGGQYEI